MAVQQQQVASLYAKISLQMSGALNQLRDFRSRLSQATNNIKTMRDQAKITGAAFTTLMTAPLALFGKTAIESVAEYQKSMAVFQLVTKASAGEMSKASEAIESVAHDLVLPQFTKADAAAALLELAKAGLSASGSVEALRPSLLLAGAGEVAAAEGAKLVALALKDWQLPASDAAKVADELAATMKFSGASFSDINEAVKIAGPTFATAGVPLDAFLTLVGELAQKGIKGSEAGTALRNMLLSLLAPTDEARGLMAGLGIKMYDADGKMRPLRDVIGDLHQAFERLTPAQHAAYAKTMFGNEAFGEALSIIGGGLPTYDDMHGKVMDVGIAEQLAKAKTEGLSGAIADASREAQNASQSAFAPMAQDLAVIAHGVADVFRWFQDLPEPVRQVAGWLGTIGTLLVVGGALWSIVSGALATAWGWAVVIGGAFEGLGGILAGLVSGPVGWTILAVATLAAGLVIAYQHSETFRDIVDSAFGAVKSAVSGMWSTVKPILDNYLYYLQRAIEEINKFTGLRITLPSLPSIPGITTHPAAPASGGLTQGFVDGVPMGGVDHRAGGGPVLPGHAYMVGEQGPEPFVPSAPGTIIPNGALSGGGNVSVTFTGPVYGFNDFEDQVVRVFDVARKRWRTT